MPVLHEEAYNYTLKFILWCFLRPLGPDLDPADEHFSCLVVFLKNLQDMSFKSYGKTMYFFVFILHNVGNSIWVGKNPEIKIP